LVHSRRRGTAVPSPRRRRDENEIEFSRAAAFSRGVFAIAITLLMLGLGTPRHLQGESLGETLWAQRESLFAYALSFAVIGRFCASIIASSPM
jgi:uncharacterized membrane protein